MSFAVPARMSSQVFGLVRRWGSDKRGNAAIMFGLSAIPVIGLMGLGLDFYQGLSYKSRLDAAADSAAIVAITTAQSYIGANSGSQADVTTPALAAGKAQASRVFPINAASALKYVPSNLSVSVTRSGQTLAATVSYSGQMQTGFAGLFGIQNYAVAGSSTSSLTMPKYLDFYLVLDTSGSMGLPTTNDGQTQLAKINPDNKSQYPSGCVFACHFPGYQGYPLTRTNNIALRADSVGSAVQALLSTAKATEMLPAQYRIGLFPFIYDVAPADPTDVTAPPAVFSDFTKPSTQAGNLASYLDTGTWVSAAWPWGSGGTHFENIAHMTNYIKTIGDGSSALQPQPFIFLVTDGANNSQTYNGGFKGGTNPALPGSTFANFCTSEKKLGVTISILYTPYVPIQNPNHSFASDEDGKVNTIIPSIPGVLQTCASPGFFFTANTPQDITNAMQQMFAQATQQARLTH